MMTRFAYFSKHALKRIKQRTKLSCFTIADMLDFGLAVHIGSEIVFDRKHWLFYSSLDDCCYVAIQDPLTGLVVTVLPVDYHENLAWKVLDAQLAQAKEISSQDISHLIHQSSTPSVKLHEDIAPSTIILKAHYLSEQGYMKTSLLAKIKADDYDGDLLNFVKDESFDAEVEFHCKKKCIAPLTVSLLSLALGKKGEPLRVDWHPSNNKRDELSMAVMH